MKQPGEDPRDPRGLFLAVALIGVSFWASIALAGPGGEGRRRAGSQQDRCGAELVVVGVSGQKEVFADTDKFMERFTVQNIDQGEQPRPAVLLDEVLKAYSAGWVDALDCNNRSVQLPSGLPFEGRDFLVRTGRGSLKAVREVRPGDFGNTIQQIRKLTFHGTSHEKRPTSAPSEKR